MYVLTVQKLRKHCRKESKNLQVFKTLTDLNFMEYFVKQVMKVMKNVSLETSKGHTQDCIVRCCFDLVFRFAIDHNYIAVQLGDSECDDYLDLQLNIFKNNNWVVYPL